MPELFSQRPCGRPQDARWMAETAGACRLAGSPAKAAARSARKKFETIN